MFTLIVIILVGMTIIMFSQEIGNLLKKIWRLPGVQRFGLLIVLSLVVAYWEDLFSYFFLSLAQSLYQYLRLFSSSFPFAILDSEAAYLLVATLFLFIISLSPSLLLLLWYKKNGRRPFEGFHLVSLFSWLAFALLLIASYNAPIFSPFL